MSNYVSEFTQNAPFWGRKFKRPHPLGGRHPSPNQSPPSRHGWKPQNCRWNFEGICHYSSRDICISGYGGHIVIFGYRSFSQSFEDTFLDVTIVGKLDFVTWITKILILDLFCHISKHDYKISPVSKNTRVWRHTKQLPVHRLTTWLLHFVPTSHSGKVTKG